MANKTIPDLTAAASVALTDLFEVAQPDSKKATGTQIQASFTGKQDALGFTPENVANKSIDGTFAANSDTLYPSQKATKTYVDAVAGGVPSSRTIATTGPLAGGGDLSANRTFSIADAAADGATKGAAAFTAADFNAAAGVISIDYTNGQAASAVNKGFLTSADWSTFNSKQAALGFTPPPNTRLINTTGPLAGGGDLSADRTISIADSVADGATKGAAAFVAADFTSAAGVIGIDYVNGQAASAVNKGFLTSADWTTFNSKASTEAPFADTTAIVKGSVDATKLLRFEVDGFTTATTRIATPPNQDFTIAGIDVAQTFSVTQTFTPAANNRAINIASAGATGASSLEFLRLAGTWNTSGTPSAFLMQITDSASNASSKLVEFQVGGSEVFSIRKTGFVNFPDGIRQTFNPNGTNAGINVGDHTADPSSLANGDIWYQSTANELRARINGATVALGASGGSAPFIDSTAIIRGSADATKLFRIEVDGFTTATTRVATPPNQDFTMAGLEVQQTFTKQQTITPAVNTSGLVVSGFSLTGSGDVPLLDLSGTWNTSEAPVGIKLNITDTASNSPSYLMSLNVGGSPKFFIEKTGAFSMSDGLFQVDSVGAFTASADSNMTGAKIYNLGTPTADADAATKAYVDLVAGGAPFVDTTAIVKGSADATKLLRFEVDGFTAATTRVATPPNQDFTIAGINVEQTFSVQQTFSATDDESIRVTGSITGSNNQPFVDISGTWNTSETVRAVLINVTDTASDANSSLLRCELGGSFRMNVDKVGGIQLAGGVSALGGITSTFSLAGASATSFIDLTGTWNTSGTPTAIRLNVTDTASNAASKLLDLQIASTTKFAVDKTGSITFSDGIRQTFNPNGTNAGINVGAHTADPSSLTNGDLWYQSTANELRARINGATVALGAGGGGTPLSGTGTPEGSVTAVVGESYLDITSTDNPSLWYKAVGTGNTGWRQLIA